MLFIGDIAFPGTLSQKEFLNESKVISLKSILDSQDFVFANLETPVGIEGIRNEYKNFTHTTTIDALKYWLKELNVFCVSLANNHIFDSKMPGLRKTIQILEETGVKYTGAGWRKKNILNP